MKTYDTDARRLNVGTFWGNLRAVLRRWLDRERELVSLRNAVGNLKLTELCSGSQTVIF